MVKARAKFQSNRDRTSVVAAFLGEATFVLLCKSGVQLLGQRCEVDSFEEAWRLDAFHGRCSEWGHITPHCQVAAPRCSIYANDHQAADHRCSAEGCRVGSGHRCPHTTVKYANCGGPHGARADVCASKREAR